MNSKDFEIVIEEQIEKCKEVLIGKAKEYAQDDDRLHNFKNAAGMMGCDPKEALAGMMAKHTISVYDMCRDGKDHTLVMWNEKITDHINYLLLLKAIVMEEKKKSGQKSGRLHYFVSPEHKVVKPGDKVEFDCDHSSDSVDALENAIKENTKRIEDLWTKNAQKQPLNCALTDPPKPGKPIFLCDEGNPTEELENNFKETIKTWDKFLKSIADKSTKEWAKKVADGLAICSGSEYRCNFCEFQKHHGCPVCDEPCSYTLMKAAKNLIETHILDSEEKND